MSTQNFATGFLRLEATLWLTLSLAAFHFLQGSWILFAFCILIPDLGILGYAINSKVGGISYNLLHSEVGPLILGVVGYFTGQQLLIKLALVWFCHINFDRMLGIGLKTKEKFDETHLGVSPFAKK